MGVHGGSGSGADVNARIKTSMDPTGIQKGVAASKASLGQFAQSVQALTKRSSDAFNRMSSRLGSNVGKQQKDLRRATAAFRDLLKILGQVEKRAGDSFQGTASDTAVMTGRIQQHLAQLEAVFGKLPAEMQQDVQGIINAFDQLQDEMKDTATEAQQAGTKIGEGMNKAQRTGNLFVTEFGRGVQDLGYGVKGFANNLDPIILSFGRLNTAAKIAGTSMSKVLVKSLTSAGGILLVVNALTTAYTTGALDPLIEKLKGTAGQLKVGADALSKWAQEARNAAIDAENLADEIDGLSDAQLRLRLAEVRFARGTGPAPPDPSLLPGYTGGYQLNPANTGASGILNFEVQGPGGRRFESKGEYDQYVRQVNLAKEELGLITEIKKREEEKNEEKDKGAKITSSLLETVKDLRREEAIRVEKYSVIKDKLQEQFEIQDNIANLQKEIANEKAVGGSPDLIVAANQLLEQQKGRLQETIDKLAEYRQALANALSGEFGPLSGKSLDQPSTIKDVRDAGDDARGDFGNYGVFLRKMEGIREGAEATGLTLQESLAKQLQAVNREIIALNEEGDPAGVLDLVKIKAGELTESLNTMRGRLELATFVGNTFANVFGEFLDVTKPFEERLNKIGDQLKELVSQLIRAAVKALILGAILKGLGAAGTGGLSFGQVAANIFSGSFGGGDIFQSSGKAAATSKSNFRMEIDGSSLYTVLENYKYEKGLV